MITSRALPSDIEERSLAEVRATGDVRWFQRALDRLNGLSREGDQRLRTFFSPTTTIHVARAPGRLDVMGGIADYSGSLVLELPLECATSVMLQTQSAPRCELATRRGERWDFFSVDLPLLALQGELGTPAALAQWFAQRQGARWASYVVGVVQCFVQRAAREGSPTPTGLRLLIDSGVPAGRGVASSAALEVAVAMAVSAACGSSVSASELATLCQAVENDVVGAPCGIMDQMTSACGRHNSLLRLLCQPASIEGHLAIPDGYRFYGIDSGVSHAVSGADYGTVRTAAFMGYRMIAARAGLSAARETAKVRIDDGRWGGYLANLSEYELAELGQGLPRQMSGARFIKSYDGITDSATVVRPRRRYPVLAATEHPVREHARVRQFAQFLLSLPDRPDAAVQMGRLMYESHRSYTACGLGSDATDRLVEMIAALGREHGLFGAKITGGGSGGTVAVFGSAAAEPLVRDVAIRYAAETSRTSSVFAASGPGAAELGVLRLESLDEAPKPA